MFKIILVLLISTISVLGASKLSFAMMCGGHSQHRQTAQTESAEHKHEAAMETTKQAVNVGNKICPVSAEKVGEGMEAVTYEYEGKVYNFCCAMCINEFKKDPQKYIKKVEDELHKGAKNEEQGKAQAEGGVDYSGDERKHRGHQH